MAARPPRPDTVDSSADTLVAAADAVGATLASKFESAPGAVDPAPHSFEPGEAATRYEQRRLLGEGGMGEVRLIKDAWIGREVAMKIAHRGRGSRSDLRARFLREVRVQGQLEHPSIVPVYDLGVGRDGETFFTMKRVKGHALDAVIRGLRDGDEAIASAFSRRKLLSALGSVCLAVAFAHSRGVIHRDLKPANVMLGDFGEVYVLDWGIAKVVGTVDAPALDPPVAAEGNAQTEAGALLGTLGYIAPELLERDRPADERSDVYALGAILFELLALEPYNAGRTGEALIAATLRGSDPRPSLRDPVGVAPELDAICERALARDPAERFATARELDDALEAYLDGERESEKRRELAEKHLVAAQAALARASGRGPDAHESRTEATRELGRVLALDPTHRGALQALMEVILDPALDLPPPAEAELAEVNRLHRARAARRSALQFVGWYVLSPVILWMGVREWRWLVALDLVICLIIGYTWWMGRTGKAQPRYMRLAVPLSFTATAMLGTFFGPFVIVPGAIAVNATLFLVSLRPNPQTRGMILWMSMFAMAIPIALHLAGVVAPAYEIRDGAITILPQMTYFPSTPTWILLVMFSLGTPLVANLMVGSAVAQLVEAERRVFAQAWRLRQLLPGGEALSVPDRLKG